jgi:thiamine kinase-like enzyme
VTHGDLKIENWIKDREGKLYLIDWSKIGFAPPERDLINFTGERFESFLLQYLQAYEHPPKLHPEFFEYYSYFLVLWSIADYGSWILLEEASLAEVSHAWQELNRYLPINHKDIQAEVNKASQILKGGIATPSGVES